MYETLQWLLSVAFAGWLIYQFAIFLFTCLVPDVSMWMDERQEAKERDRVEADR